MRHYKQALFGVGRTLSYSRRYLDYAEVVSWGRYIVVNDAYITLAIL